MLLPSPGKEAPCAPTAAGVAPARCQQQRQIRFACPTKQGLILLNKYRVMAAGLGAKWPGDILGSREGALQRGRSSSGSGDGVGQSCWQQGCSWGRSRGAAGLAAGADAAAHRAVLAATLPSQPLLNGC